MRRIPLLFVDSTEVFDEIAAAKREPRRGRMQAARAEVLAAYQGYVDVVPEVGNLNEVQLTNLQKEAMRHAFTVETAPMTALRGRILERICVARCPFCGISESSTLDHYLPMERHPEFSVFPNNLIPSCAVCNTRKRDRILDEQTNVRMFLHPYYDFIPNSAFLVVSASMNNDGLILSYSVIQPTGMALGAFQRLQSHFKQLGLADRYRRMSLEHLGGQYPAFRRAYGSNGDAERVAEKLIRGAEDFEEGSGQNYWIAKLYRALATNLDFCDGGFEVVKT